MSAKLRVLLFGSQAVALKAQMAALAASGVEPVIATTADEVAALIAAMLPDVAITNSDLQDDTPDFQAQYQHCFDARLPVLELAPSGAPANAGGLVENLSPDAPPAQIKRRCDALARLSRIQRELNRRVDTVQDFGKSLKSDIMDSIKTAARCVLIAGNAPASALSTLQQSFQILKVAGITEALEPLYSHNVDIVVLFTKNNVQAIRDISEQIRRDTRFFHLPIIAVIERPGAETAADVISAGITELISPPYSNDDVSFAALNLVKQQLYRRKLVEETRRALQIGTQNAETAFFNQEFLQTHLAKHLPQQITLANDFSIGTINLYAARQEGGEPDKRDARADERALMIGDLLQNLIRAEDLPARIGPQQFLILMPDTAYADAEVVMHRIGSVLRNTEFFDEREKQAYSLEIQTAVTAVAADDDAKSLLQRASAAAA